MLILQSAAGLVLMTLMAWGLSEARGRLPWRTAGAGLAVQLLLAVLLLKLPLFAEIFVWLNRAVLALQEATAAGTSFVFGYLAGGPAPYEISYPASSFILGFQALPLILVVSALAALLFHWRVLPAVVKGFSWGLKRSLGVGGAVGVSAAANVFVGMVEAPLLVRPYLAALSRSEMFMVMTCGMATVAGTLMVIYVTAIGSLVPDAAGHILTASLLSAPAAIMIAKIMVPGDGTLTEAPTLDGGGARTAMDAITTGTTQGMALLINVVAMLVVLVALVALANMVLGLFPDLSGAPLTRERMLGWLLAPLAWIMGIPWAEAQAAGNLLGVKIMLNEVIAYFQMAALPESTLSARSHLIMTYALCGFANFGSLGIMIGGLATAVPEKRDEVVGLGLKSIVSGTLACCMTGAIVGVIG